MGHKVVGNSGHKPKQMGGTKRPTTQAAWVLDLIIKVQEASRREMASPHSTLTLIYRTSTRRALDGHMITWARGGNAWVLMGRRRLTQRPGAGI
jgi:hypothetical protein